MFRTQNMCNCALTCNILSDSIKEVTQRVTLLEKKHSVPLQKESLINPTPSQSIQEKINKNKSEQTTIAKLTSRIAHIDEEMSVLSNKINEVMDKITLINTSTSINTTQDADSKNQKQDKMLQQALKLMKQDPKKLIDETPYVNSFKAEGNNITLVKEHFEDGENWPQQILLKVMIPSDRVFSFSATVLNTKTKELYIGVVDRREQREQMTSASTVNAICYYGADGGGLVYSHKGEWDSRQTNQELSTGMKVTVQVNIPHSSVTFVLTKGTLRKQFKVLSDILHQECRQFVPYFQIFQPGDSIQWEIS